MKERSDVVAAMATVLVGVPAGVRAAIARNAVGGSEDALVAEVVSAARRELGECNTEGVSCPPELDEDEQEQWASAAVQAVDRPKDERTLSALLPALAQRVGIKAEDARGKLRARREEHAALQQELRHLKENEELHFSADSNDTSRSLVGLRCLTSVLWGLLVLVEVFGVQLTMATFFGLTEYQPIAAAPAGLWLKSLGVGLPAAIGLLGLPLLIERAAGRMLAGRLARAGALVFAVLTLCTLVAGLSSVRWSSHALDGSGYAIGSAGVLVLVALPLLPVVVLAEWLRTRAADLGERIRLARKVENFYKCRKARLGSEVEEVRTAIRVLGTAAEEPQRLASLFEGSVREVELRREDDERVVRERALQARSSWRRLQQFSRAEREYIQRRLVKITPVAEGEGDDGLVAPVVRRAARAVPAVLILLAPIVLALSGCAVAEPAAHEILACDPTGPSPAAVCNERVVEGEFRRFVARSLASPNTAFQLVVSGGSYSEALVRPAIRMPSRWRNVRAEREAWTRQALASLLEEGLPADTPENRDINRSDLIGLLVLASQLARDLADPAELVLASDLRFVSLGFNAEDDVPAAGEVLARLKAAGVEWDLSMFSSVRVCGLHARGATPRQVGELREVTRELIEAGGADLTSLSSSCEGSSSASSMERALLAASAQGGA